MERKLSAPVRRYARGGRPSTRPSNRCGIQGGCEPATASSRSPGGSLRERRAASDRRLWEAVVCRGTMRCLRVTLLTGRHGTSCRGDGSGLLLECRKAREPLRSKRWLASAAASENTWTRDPGAHRADASPLSGVDRDLVYAPAPCGWVETVYDAPLCDSTQSARRSLWERKTGFNGAAPRTCSTPGTWRLHVRPAWKFGPSIIRRGSPRDLPDRSSR